MAENLMNSAHKASTKKSRKEWARIFGSDPRDPTEGDQNDSEDQDDDQALRRRIQ